MWLISLLNKWTKKTAYNIHTKLKWALFRRILILRNSHGPYQWCKRNQPFTNWATRTCNPLVNYVSATLCEVMEIIKGCFVFIIIHSCAKNGLMCRQKKHIFLLLGWRDDDSWSQDKVIFLVPIEFGSLDFMVLDFIYIKWNAFTYLSSFYQCMSHVFCSKVMSQA